MKCLFCKNPEDFLNYTEKFINRITPWYVQEGTITERYEKIKYNTKYDDLHEAAKKNKIIYNPTEIISWLDNMSELYYIFNDLKNEIQENQLESNFFDNMYIVAEYHIPFNKNRIDYLIAKDDKILLIEFSYCNDEKSKDHYKRKLNQVIYYQDLLKSSLSEHIKINIFTFLIKPEKINFSKKIMTTSKHSEEEVFPNYDECLYLSQLIKHTFSNTKKTAIEELNIYGDRFLYY